MLYEFHTLSGTIFTARQHCQYSKFEIAMSCHAPEAIIAGTTSDHTLQFDRMYIEQLT